MDENNSKLLFKITSKDLKLNTKNLEFYLILDFGLPAILVLFLFWLSEGGTEVIIPLLNIYGFLVAIMIMLNFNAYHNDENFISMQIYENMIIIEKDILRLIMLTPKNIKTIYPANGYNIYGLNLMFKWQRFNSFLLSGLSYEQYYNIIDVIKMTEFKDYFADSKFIK